MYQFFSCNDEKKSLVSTVLEVFSIMLEVCFECARCVSTEHDRVFVCFHCSRFVAIVLEVFAGVLELYLNMFRTSDNAKRVQIASVN